MSSGKLTAITAALLVSSATARADVEISSRPTSNMSCAGGVCTATAQKAVLNVTDLANMLASGDVAVKTGLVAKDIDIDQPLQWTSTSRLTLDAQQSVTIKKQITVAGQGALTVVTNDTGGAKAKNKAGEFVIVPEHGSVQFWDLGSSLIIDGNSYTLVGDIKTLASDIAANPSGFYALAKDYDASVDGAYATSPVATPLVGVFDGLGHHVSGLTIQFTAQNGGVTIGLLSLISKRGVVRHIGVVDSTLVGISSLGNYGAIGLLAGGNQGKLLRCWATGSLKLPGGAEANLGGLVGHNEGALVAVFARAKIRGKSGNSRIGGLAGANSGVIDAGYAAGSVGGDKHDTTVDIGGLAGSNFGVISNTFAISSVHQAAGCCEALGGLVGVNDSGGTIATSYAAGYIKFARTGAGYAGGFVGFDGSGGGIVSSYWDLDRGIDDPAQGAGNKNNDPGISGLTTKQLQSSLPDGFDHAVWGQNGNVNHGLPYLLEIRGN